MNIHNIINSIKSYETSINLFLHLKLKTIVGATTKLLLLLGDIIHISQLASHAPSLDKSKQGHNMPDSKLWDDALFRWNSKSKRWQNKLLCNISMCYKYLTGDVCSIPNVLSANANNSYNIIILFNPYGCHRTLLLRHPYITKISMANPCQYSGSNATSKWVVYFNADMAHRL